jgi:hypothetical protein
MGLLPLLTLGFFLGIRHATDSDHVVAVTTIVSREKTLRAASLVGAFWGLGHTLTIMMVGGSIILFGLVLPARLGLTLELSVALMLVVLGGLNVAGFRRREVQGGDAAGSGALRSLVVGTVHGLAGSAAIALLVLTTIHDSRWAMLYLFLFGVGTVAGMMLITSTLALPFIYTARYSARGSSVLRRHMGWVTGALSLGLGLFLVYQIGFVDGLFGARPHWDPQ